MLTDIYPVVTSHGTLMNDKDLTDLVRMFLSEDIALVLEHRLEIARPRPKLDEKIKQAWESLSDACRDLEIVLDHLDEYNEED